METKKRMRPRTVRNVGGKLYLPLDNQEERDRVIACVNACEGVDDPEGFVREVVRAVGACVDVLRFYHDRTECENPMGCGHCQAMRRALRFTPHTHLPQDPSDWDMCSGCGLDIRDGVHHDTHRTAEAHCFGNISEPASREAR